MSARLLLAVCLLGFAAACKDDPPSPDGEPGPGGGGPPVTVGMTCGAPNGTTIPCDIQLGNTTAFRVTLVSTECVAITNVVRLTKPAQETLTTNGCYEAPGKFWEFRVEPNSAAALEITGGEQRSGPQLRVEGAASPWTIRYEDGYDTDFDDIVLRVEAL